MDWYSVRMRAAEGGPHEQGGAHISGGERLVAAEAIEETVQSLVRRALTHEKGRPDFLNVTVEFVPAQDVRELTALPVHRRAADDIEAGHRAAVELLAEAGIATDVAERAVQLVANGPAPDGGAMRGAIVMNADTGERLESDPARGVRVAKIDWHPEALAMWRDAVRQAGIANERIQEALALATKVIATESTVAELCWSDDPGYVSGYVAAPQLGYVRIPHLKPLGSPLGGRVFFVRGLASVEDVRDYEERLQVPCLLANVASPAIYEEKESCVR
jgi:6-carboxyhexanoate--CoA ligase